MRRVKQFGFREMRPDQLQAHIEEMAQSYERADLKVQALESWRAAAITAGIYIPDDELLRLDRRQGWADAKPQ